MSSKTYGLAVRRIALTDGWTWRPAATAQTEEKQSGNPKAKPTGQPGGPMALTKRLISQRKIHDIVTAVMGAFNVRWHDSQRLGGGEEGGGRVAYLDLRNLPRPLSFHAMQHRLAACERLNSCCGEKMWRKSPPPPPRNDTQTVQTLEPNVVSIS